MNKIFLIVPGINNSNELHWQSIWEKKYPNFYRINQKQWQLPNSYDWIQNIEYTVANYIIDNQIIIIAHSLGCIAVAQWLQNTSHCINRVFLVAPPNISIIEKNKLATGFTKPNQKLSVPSIVIASSNDPFASLEISKKYAKIWGSTFINIGEKGHINAESNIGEWTEGYTLLNSI